ncbi:glycosyl hydrolase, family 15, partial [mine drainage metagenome]
MIVPVGEYGIKQAYIENTNVIKTTFYNSEAEFDVIDYLPYYKKGDVVLRNSEVHRVLIRKRGRPVIRILIEPRMEYNKYEPTKTIDGDKIAFSYKATSIYLYSNLGLKEILAGSEISLWDKGYVLLTYNKLKYTTSTDYI